MNTAEFNAIDPLPYEAAIDPTWMVNARMVNALLQVAESFGASRTLLLMRSKIESDSLLHPETRLPAINFLRLARLTESWTGNPNVGLYTGRVWNMLNSNSVRYLSTISPTFRDGMKQFPNMAAFGVDLGDMQIQKAGQCICVEWIPLVAEMGRERFLTDSMLADAALNMNSVGILPVQVLRVDFTYSKPKNLAPLETTFACKELHFNRPVSGIYYSAETLDYPMIRAGEDLHEEVVSAMQKIFDIQGTSAPFLRSVRDIIARSLPKGNTRIADVAARLNVSSRTLQRQLKENDTSFSQVLQNVRKSMAVYYLQHKGLNITQTAFILGYSSPEAFTKAFKLWCGMTPQSFLLK